MLDLLVTWFQENHRPLPWRVSYDPYQVWLSEVMLQQTQVETALPYYERFIREFPTVESLAKADEERVLTLWAGLGYYRRAKNLMEAARQMASQHHGEIPSDYDVLIQLPGIGRYMAGAILSIAFNKPYPIVDGNVRRVLSRIEAWSEEDPQRLWRKADELVHAGEPRLVNQALMELGAKICSFKSPRCLVCPVQSFCEAFRKGWQERIPPVRKRASTVHIHLFAIVDRKNGLSLMRLVNGLWEFPTFSERPEGNFRTAGRCRHSVTHHRLDITVCEGKLTSPDGLEWKRITEAPISSLTRKIWDVVTGR